MSRINTNVGSLIAQNSLAQNQAAEQTSLQRLSTGLQINSGEDNPSGLIAAQNLLANQTGITTAISNGNLADNVIATADGGLSEVSSLLTQLQGLLGQAANSGGNTPSELSADQLQVDSILGTINSISNSTSFDGTQLLNGSLQYSTSSVVGSSIANVQVNSAIIAAGSSETVDVDVIGSAKTAALGYTGGSIGSSGVTLQVEGNQGATQLSFASGSTVSSIAAAINAVTNTTGLSAQVSGSDLRVNSQGYGSSQYVSITAVSGTFSGLSATKAEGTDANVTVNGATAVADGTNIAYHDSNLDLSFTLTNKFNTHGNSTFTITGGGATFELGASVTQGGLASIGIQSVATGSLGDNTNGFLESIGTGGANSLSSNNLTKAQDIINTAINQVSTLRGRLGAFQKYTIGSTLSNLNVAYENVSAATSNIEDTNFASETSNLTRAEILTSAATSVLSSANSQPQNVLKLLSGI